MPARNRLPTTPLYRRDQACRCASESAELLSQTTGWATRIEQRRLQLTPGALVVRTVRRRRDKARIFMHEEACLATGRIPGLAGGQAGNCRITCLAARNGVHLGRARETVVLEEADARAAVLLGVEPRTPLMRVERTVFTSDDLPIEWRLGLCLLDDGDVRVKEMS